MQRRHHYELAFEHYLREHRLPYVAVDEARKALLPEGTIWAAGPGDSLKSFDFVLYGQGANLLAEVKGRRVGGAGRKARLDSWVTHEDVESLLAWERLFGEGFLAALLFVYWCDEQPPAPLFEEVFEFKGRWYAVRTVLARDYARLMKPRSARWRTVHVPAAGFDVVSRGLRAALAGIGQGEPLHPVPGLVASGSDH